VTDEVLADLKREIEDTAGKLKKEFARVRTGRASASLLDSIFVEYYGARTQLKQLATVNVPEARLIAVTPYDRKSIAEIERAIKGSELGLNPMSDGAIIRIPIPELTEERRRDLVKHVKKIAEDFRVSTRNHRRDANELIKELQKEKQVTEDDARHAQEKIQTLTNEGIERIDRTLKAKEDEIMVV